MAKAYFFMVQPIFGLPPLPQTHQIITALQGGFLLPKTNTGQKTMQLYLCEKPSQARDIAQVLNAGERHESYLQTKGITVTWAFGHILAQAMPEEYGSEYKQWKLATLPLIPEQWQMQIQNSAAKQFKTIKQLLKEADEVIIATDADREGEVIAREILDYCGYRGKVRRFWTSGLDTASIQKALANIRDGETTENLYQAGLARQRADWLIGMNLSRAYTIAYAQGYGKEHTLSIGRVQTPTLKLVVERDIAIETFKPYPYYRLTAAFKTTANETFQAAWQIPETFKNEDGYCTNQTMVSELAAQIRGKIYPIARAETTAKHTPAPLPYSLSALQKEASQKLSISPAKVLDIAQSLYEKHKLTSYPRTPCRYLPESQRNEVQQILTALQTLDPSLSGCLKDTNPNKDSRVWNDAEVNKHSHHAIIPTRVSSHDLNRLNPEERTIYEMIRNRYIAQFLPDYEYEAAVIEIEAEEQVFKATGHTPKILGWKILLTGGNETENTPEQDQDEAINPSLPELNTGETVTAADAKVKRQQTKAPPKFTEAALLDEMRSLSDYLKHSKDTDKSLRDTLKTTEGLGTEATRAQIIERLLSMGYVEKQKGKLTATEKGKHLIAAIPPQITDPITTAQWEDALAAIEAGKTSIETFLNQQAKQLTELIEQAKKDAKTRTPPSANQPAKLKGSTKQIGQICPSCKKGKLQQRHLKDKPEKHFLGCTNYPKCKHFEWLQ